MIRKPGTALPAAVLTLFLALTAPGTAATIIYLDDLDADGDPPPLPQMVDATNRPVYVTNRDVLRPDIVGAVDTLRVGQQSSLHLGYDHSDVAAGVVNVDAANGLTVEGNVHLGKTATPGESGLPEAATRQQINLGVTAGDFTVAGGSVAARVGTASPDDADRGVHINVAGSTVVTDGGSVALYGVGENALATLATERVSLSGGSLALGAYARVDTALTTGGAATPAYAVDIGSGGVLTLGGGVAAGYDPENPSAEVGIFAGLDTATGGDGIRVATGGVLAAGGAGGLIAGQAGGNQSLVVEASGSLNASRGRLVVNDYAGVDIAGSYLAGYNNNTKSINRLVAADSAIAIRSTATLGMTKDLQKALAASPYLTIGNAAIMRGAGIAFDPGDVRTVPVVKTALGQFTLAVGVDPDDLLTSLYVTSIANGVTGEDSAADRAAFRKNLAGLYRPRINSAFADNVYDLSVADSSPITVKGDAGKLNQEVFEAMVSGYGQPIGNRGGKADDSVMEMYIGASQYGTNSVAHNTATEVVSAVGMRINQLRSETVAIRGSGSALAFFNAPEHRRGRVWAGGFGRREEADLDYGVAGYKYEPRGVIAGYDRLFGSVAVGGAVAYGKGDYTDKASVSNNSDIASYSASLYASYYSHSGFNLSGFATYSYLDNDIRDVRGGLRRTADHGSEAWSVGARAGYDLCPAERLVLTPSVGVVRVRATNRAHQEYLDGLAVIRVGEVKRRSTLLPVEIGIGFDLFQNENSLFRLNTSLGYAYDFERDGLAGDIVYNGLEGTRATPVGDRDIGRNRFNFGAGVLYSGSRVDLSIRYDYFRRDNTEAQQVKGSLGVKF